MSPNPPTAPARRKATPAELAAPALISVAMVALAGTLVQQRLAAKPPPAPPPPPKLTAIVSAPPQEGVKLIPSAGRLLLIDSTPDGANILIDGAPRGETPFSADYSCTAGQRTVVELKRSGYRAAKYELDCADGTTRISATLKSR